MTQSSPELVCANKLDDIAAAIVKHLGALDEWCEHADALAEIADHLRALTQPESNTTRKATAVHEISIVKSDYRIEALVDGFTVTQATYEGDGIWRIPNPRAQDKPHFFADIAATENALTTIATAYIAGRQAHTDSVVCDQRHAYLFYGALLAEINGLATHLADLNSRQVHITSHGAHLDVLAQITNAVAGAEVLVRDSQTARETEAAR